MATAPDSKVKGWLRYPQLGEELIRNHGIEMLSGVEDPLRDRPITSSRGSVRAADSSTLMNWAWPPPP